MYSSTIEAIASQEDMKNDNVKDQIRDYILENYLFTTDQSALGDDASLIDAGVIDSTGVLEIIMFLEEQFGIKIADEEMIPENLDSVEKIVSFVHRKGG